MESNKIIDIPVEQLYGHPNNPRKNVGDVTELADSIRQNGLMQNLTVVPGHLMTDDEYNDLCEQYSRNPTETLRMVMNKPNEKKFEEGYTVIIGHRRLAAAKQAGLKTVPCAVRYDMSEKEQIATMIAENMQRVDLTVVEQAQSMQMMIDLGDSVDQVSEKTGLSKSTVRNRLKIASLDPSALKKSEERQITIGDYMKVLEIEDESTRNIVLATAGTHNFAREYDKAIMVQNDKKKKEKVQKYLLDNGYIELEKTDSYVSYKNLYNLNLDSDLDKEIGKAKKGWNYFSYYWGLSLFRERNESDQARDIEREKEKRWRDGCDRRIAEITEEMYSRMRECFDVYSPKKGDLDLLKNAFIFSTFRNYASRKNAADLLELNVEHASQYGWDEKDYIEPITESYKENPEKTLLAWLISQILDLGIATTTWTIPYKVEYVHGFINKRDNFLKICDVLEQFGFDLADEERDFVTGKHPIFDERYERDQEAAE